MTRYNVDVSRQKERKVWLYIILVVVFLVIGFLNKPEEKATYSPPVSNSSAVKPNKESGLKAPVSITKTIQGMRYDVLDFGSILWMADDLNIGAGEGYVMKKAVQIDVEKNEIKYSEPKWKNQESIPLHHNIKATKYYTRRGAEIACHTIGWRLPTSKELKQILKFVAPNSINKSTYDKYRAYGLLIDKGDLRFNMKLMGRYNLEPYDNFLNEYPYVRVEFYSHFGYLWTSSNSKNGDPVFLRLDKRQGEAIFLNIKSNRWAMPCRCVRDKTPSK